jgi:hypothetical protein
MATTSFPCSEPGRGGGSDGFSASSILTPQPQTQLLSAAALKFEKKMELGGAVSAQEALAGVCAIAEGAAVADVQMAAPAFSNPIQSEVHTSEVHADVEAFGVQAHLKRMALLGDAAAGASDDAIADDLLAVGKITLTPPPRADSPPSDAMVVEGAEEPLMCDLSNAIFRFLTSRPFTQEVEGGSQGFRT